MQIVLFLLFYKIFERQRARESEQERLSPVESSAQWGEQWREGSPANGETTWVTVTLCTRRTDDARGFPWPHTPPHGLQPAAVLTLLPQPCCARTLPPNPCLSARLPISLPSNNLLGSEIHPSRVRKTSPAENLTAGSNGGIEDVPCCLALI